MSPLPASTGLTLDPAARLLPGADDTSVLIGGSPYTVLTLKPAAAALLQSLRNGSSLTEAAATAGVSVNAAQRLARRLLATGLAEPVHHAPAAPSLDSTPSLDSLTAVIPVRNEAAAIGQLVRSLLDAGVPRVIVVDDGSTDDSAPNAHVAGAHVIQTAGGQGPGAARNLGAAQVDTSLVLFVDADVELTNGCLHPLLAAFADPDVVAAAPRVRSSPGHSPDGLISRYEHIRSPLDLGERRASVRPRSRVAYVPTAAMLVDVDAFRSHGGFDETMRTGEDVDLVWRLVQSGRTVRYEPDATVSHRPRATIRALVQQRRGYGRSAATLDAHHPGLVAPVAASGWSLLAWCLAICGGAPGVVAGVGTAVGTSASLERKLDMLASPRKVSWELAMRGHWGVGWQLATAVWRAWLPFALVGSVFSRRIRVATLAAALLPNVADWRRDRPPIGPVPFTAMRVLDDASYCLGVWEGCLRERRLRCIRPHVANWPPRRDKSRVDR